MGEVNYKLSAQKPVITRAGTNYSPGAFPYAGYTRMKGAKGVFVNISRACDNYRIGYSKARLVDFDEDNFAGSIRGWMAPEGKTTAQFLENLSRYGFTHHSIFVVGATGEQIEFFASLTGMEAIEI